jgi:hypothetical protein
MGFKALIFVLLLVTGFVACGKKHGRLPSEGDGDHIKKLKARYALTARIASIKRDKKTGWITPRDCDGMIWSGKYAATTCDKVDILAAEFDGSGRFGRRPPPRCWDGEDNGSKTTWSRDMAVAGLIPWAYACGELEVLERHAAYGKEHNWVMGEPNTAARVVYTPQVIGLLYQAIYALGGENSINRLWPSTYPKGLDDYEAHLQMMQIWLRGQMEAPKVAPTPISDQMLKRIKEHAKREPRNPFYRYMAGLYDGDMQPAIDLLLAPDRPVGGYVRCHKVSECANAEWLWVANLVLQRFP